MVGYVVNANNSSLLDCYLANFMAYQRFIALCLPVGSLPARSLDHPIIAGMEFTDHAANQLYLVDGLFFCLFEN